MLNFSRLWIWKYIRDKLPWYYEVAINRKPAKYLIAARIPVNEKITELGEGELWREFERALKDFLELWRRVRSNEVDIRGMPKASPSLLDLVAEITRRMIRHCEFCEWRCRSIGRVIRGLVYACSTPRVGYPHTSTTLVRSYHFVV
ncbi:hypothetical protein [Vulcanisaeta distributa]|uniref:hypothetical protein n=1 Tax=Vulcanisaeta distributa TaxID=164451 RepID=UPI000A517357|nr:hypothetical protein [Vulcanisaeta distributa]